MPQKVYTPEETAANRKKWVKALRSGDYEQAEGKLHDGVGYCCLGVACDISKLGKWLPNESYQVGRDKYADFLPPAVQAWLGLRTDNGRFIGDENHEGPNTLSVLNDEQCNLRQIADIIEAEPEGLLMPGEKILNGG